MAGRFYEEFEVGQRFVHDVRRTVTETDNVLVCALTHNPAAIHLDHEYSRKTEFGKPLMNSIFTLGLMVGLSVSDTTHGTTVANLGWESINFPRPFFAGDTMRVETTVESMRESKSRPDCGLVVLYHQAFNQKDEEIANCRRTALMLKKPAD